MEQYRYEIKRLREQLNALEAKIEKPAFEVGKWNYFETEGYKKIYKWLVFVTEVDSEGEIIGYGFDLCNGFFHCESRFLNIKEIIKSSLATPKEVKPALEKEAVKRGLIAGAKVENCGLCPSNPDYFISKNPKYGFDISNALWVSSKEGYNICIFDNGTWAESIKTMTIDELASNLIGLDLEDTKSEIIKMKSQTIEALNNLENENR